jgi:hypothetical protein
MYHSDRNQSFGIASLMYLIVYTARCLRVHMSQNKAGTRHLLSHAASCPAWIPHLRWVFLGEMTPFSAYRYTVCSDTKLPLAIKFDAIGCRKSCPACRGRNSVAGRSGAKRVHHVTTCTTGGDYRLRLRQIFERPTFCLQSVISIISKQPRCLAGFSRVTSNIRSGVPPPMHRESEHT